MFATDTDLFVFDPTPFTEFTHLGRHLLRATGQIEGDLLTLSQPDIPLSSTRAGVGDVMLIAGLALELMSAVEANEVSVCLPRARGEAASLPPPFATQVGVVVSFAAQRTLVARRMLHLAGIDPDDTDTIARITNGPALADVQVLGTLALLYRTAGVLLPEEAPINIRARDLQRAFEQMRERVAIRLDACAPRRSTPSQPIRG